MKQIPLDIALPPRPHLHDWLAGPNEQVLAHMRQRIAAPDGAAPSYVWGPGGSGKTHLLRGVAQALRAQGAAVGWLDADTAADAATFDPRWRAVVLDDVDRYDARQQHTAFTWFVHALTPQRGAPRWVLAAGSLPVADLPLREDLRTRLGWGQVHALQPLHEDDVRAVLRHAAAQRGLDLPDELLGYMLRRFSRDLGSLNHLLALLDAYSLQTRRALTVPLLRQMLNES